MTATVLDIGCIVRSPGPRARGSRVRGFAAADQKRCRRPRQPSRLLSRRTARRPSESCRSPAASPRTADRGPGGPRAAKIDPWRRSPKCSKRARLRRRRSWSRRSRRAGSAATPAATSVRFPKAPLASAACATCATGCCTCRGATSAACSAIRSRRSRSSTPAGCARVQLRHARLRPALLVLPELGDVAGAPRSAGGVAAARRRSRRRWSAKRCGSAAASWSAPTTSR